LVSGYDAQEDALLVADHRESVVVVGFEHMQDVVHLFDAFEADWVDTHDVASSHVPHALGGVLLDLGDLVQVHEDLQDVGVELLAHDLGDEHTHHQRDVHETLVGDLEEDHNRSQRQTHDAGQHAGRTDQGEHAPTQIQPGEHGQQHLHLQPPCHCTQHHAGHEESHRHSQALRKHKHYKQDYCLETQLHYPLVARVVEKAFKKGLVFGKE